MGRDGDVIGGGGTSDGDQGMTTTGLVAWWATWSLTEPSTALVSRPWPREPTTTSDAWELASTSAALARSATARHQTGSVRSDVSTSSSSLTQEAVGSRRELGRVGPRRGETGRRGGQMPGVHGDQRQPSQAGVVDGPLQRPA